MKEIEKRPNIANDISVIILTLCLCRERINVLEKSLSSSTAINKETQQVSLFAALGFVPNSI